MSASIAAEWHVKPHQMYNFHALQWGRWHLTRWHLLRGPAFGIWWREVEMEEAGRNQAPCVYICWSDVQTGLMFRDPFLHQNSFCDDHHTYKICFYKAMSPVIHLAWHKSHRPHKLCLNCHPPQKQILISFCRRCWALQVQKIPWDEEGPSELSKK